GRRISAEQWDHRVSLVSREPHTRFSLRLQCVFAADGTHSPSIVWLVEMLEVKEVVPARGASKGEFFLACAAGWQSARQSKCLFLRFLSRAGGEQEPNLFARGLQPLPHDLRR